LTAKLPATWPPTFRLPFIVSDLLHRGVSDLQPICNESVPPSKQEEKRYSGQPDHFFVRCPQSPDEHHELPGMTTTCAYSAAGLMTSTTGPDGSAAATSPSMPWAA